jgi:hypothetical protein
MQSRNLLFFDFGEQLCVESRIMIFEFDGGKPVDLKKSFISEAFFVLDNRKPVPDVSKLDNVILGMQDEMVEN